MDLKLPLILAREGGRLVKAWLPHWPDVSGSGTSLSELRDDLALKVMERFEKEPPAQAHRYQHAPHLLLRHVKLQTEARDRELGLKYALEGRMAVLLEKWPREAFWVATPTRLPQARFALEEPEELEQALRRVMERWCLDHRVETLDAWSVTRNEELDILEVDADAPTVLPRGVPRPRKKRPAKKPGASKKAAAKEPPETEEEREQRRNRRRLSVRTLRTIAQNLAHQARDERLPRAFGREGLVRKLLESIDGREGAAVCLVGRSGSGKTALVHELTRRLVERQKASGTRRDVWRMDGNQFIAGMSYVGQWEARARELCTELVETGDVLYVDDLAALVYAGRHSKGDTHVGQYLEPHLARRELTLVAECTPERFEKVREEAPTFAALFDVIQVPELTEAQTLPVLLGVVRELEGSIELASGALRPRVSPAVLEVLLTLSGRFGAHQALPGRAVRLLQRVLSEPGWPQGRERRYKVVDVYSAMRRETGLPDFVLGAAAPRKREEIVADLSAQVAGQPEAISAVADAVLALQLSLQDPTKPLANHLFVGPTGVGKTETAKALARYLFGSADRMVRLDMSELSSPYSVARLVGEAGGADGELTTALRTQPFCVVLLDEVEKAHPRVFDALLQFLGEGRLTDARGHTADGRNAVVIMTSNLGVREAVSRTGFSRGDVGGAAQHYVSAARAFFRPELFNRLNRVVPFRSLDEAALKVVVEHALSDLLSRRGVRRGNVLVEVEKELLDLLVTQAYDPRYGARPLKRALERRLAVPLAHHLLRRGAEDLALVELLRHGDDLSLSVRVLRRTASVPVTSLDALKLPQLTEEAKAARERLVALEASAAAERLRSERRRLLGGGSSKRSLLPPFTPSPSTPLGTGYVEGRSGPAADFVLGLLDRLDSLSATLTDLEESELEPERFDEEELSEVVREGRRPGRPPSRPVARVRGVQLQVSDEAIVRRVAPRLQQLVEELTLLEVELRASVRAPERVALLAERVGAAGPQALQAALTAVPVQLLGGTRLEEREDGWAPASSAGVEGRLPKRVAFAFEGPDAQRLLARWGGYAVLDTVDEAGVLRRGLVRLSALPVGEEGFSAALAAHDAQVKAEREARRAGGLKSGGQDGEVILEKVGREPPVTFVATGLKAPEQRAHLAACLRGDEE